MRKTIDEAHLLKEFIEDQPAYSPDFKALVLRLLDQHQDVEEVAKLTLVPARTLYRWINDWNGAKKSPD